MDQAQAAKLKQILLEEKARLEEELGRIAKKNPAIKGDWLPLPRDASEASDSLDERALDVTDLEERRAIEQNLELRLKEIDETLQILQTGTYGVCSNCASPIETKRLQAMPVMKLCFDCATKANLV